MKMRESEDSMLAQYLAGCSKEELVQLLGRVYDHIEYKEKIEEALRGNWLAKN
jgi:hypothetical protein